MRAGVRPLVVIAIVVATSFVPARAHAQLKQAQERGWTNLKDAYALIVSMRDSKSNRTRSNYETALGKLLTSMSDMSPYIDKMGERVGDEERSWAAGIRDSTRTALCAMIDPYERLKRAVESNRDSSDKLAELSDEIERMKVAIEAFEGACRGAFNNYVDRWNVLKRAMDEFDAQVRSAQDRVDPLRAQHDALYRQEATLLADQRRAADDYARLTTMADDLLVQFTQIWDLQKRSTTENNLTNSERYRADYLRVKENAARLIDLRIATNDRMVQLAADIKRKEQERVEKWREMMPYIDQYVLVQNRFLVVLGRWVLWDTEFPARDYRLMTLR
jgi:hypothetical protein